MSDENVGGLPELLRCPFCGESAEIQVGYHAKYDVKIGCVDCGSEGALFGADDYIGDDKESHKANAIAAWNRRALSAHGQPVVGEARPMDTYVSGLALIWMPEFDHYAAGWWKGSVISGITRLQTPLVQDDKQLWLEMTDMQPLGWMPLPEPPTFLTGDTP